MYDADGRIVGVGALPARVAMAPPAPQAPTPGSGPGAAHPSPAPPRAPIGP
jgi:hypothetical protein